jgi:hypothetical protein
VIVPTVGRIVWYSPPPSEHYPRIEKQPFAAIVVGVWSDKRVNLAFYDANGNQHAAKSVILLQDEDPIPESIGYCMWMPYQKSVAKGEILPVLHYPAVSIEEVAAKILNESSEAEKPVKPKRTKK